ncbi:hypothetical protein Baya_1655 [Bagarius yarrelli]|uniref:Uncharacterized protein n=1 Tax=Bagarius yarrelli TaxID=175774 RepID=A0A556TLQ3_BAGYA|nr:hypothetical protein Baya_1655 [Bagarius yarrelli]
METSVSGVIVREEREALQRNRGTHPPAVRSVHLSRSSEFGESDTKQQRLSNSAHCAPKKDALTILGLDALV